MAQLVEFQGKVHKFPDNASQDQIRGALMSLLPASEGMGKVDTGVRKGDGLVALSEKQETFRENIQTIETGGLENNMIRTLAPGSSEGSTAYGSYQITMGLAEGYLENHASLFDEDETRALETMIERQDVAIAIGGRDRKRYEKGGAGHAKAKQWAKKYGYENVDEFLDAFDYGGDMGLAEDADWQVHYENFGRKMLNKHLKDAGGDEIEAATMWHGGTNWKKTSPDTTRQYIAKYKKLQN
ncbi:hypothetical protein NVP1034O_27 [Vibrio phage 1.034.O._10N.261.46.B7]|nr:hypothetical protein NVP1034O_27 [Vibrio phage 1.034.O._10N.261.46.B7]AUR83457.1 hypothetical protein NVP1034X_27 [Vibrio phage 1.034.X._10N.261.46.B7]